MAKLTLELPYSYDQKDIATWLADNKLTHLKSHGEYWIKSGDALKSAKGVIARVVWKGNNEVGEPHIVIANNKLSSDEMFSQFQPSVHVYPAEVPQGFYAGMDRDGNVGIFEDYEQSIGELCELARRFISKGLLITYTSG